MLPGYMEGLERAGALPVVLPLTQDRELLRQIVSQFDGVLFTGGQDCAPSFYGEENRSCDEICDARDNMEKILFEEALAADLPMFGICRGIQLMNALLSGSLWQDIPSECPSEVIHCQGPPYGAASHNVTLFGRLKDFIGKNEMRVNSYHHQGIKALSPELLIGAVAPDGLVEGVWMPGKRFVVAVQWHPEMALEDENSGKLFGAFVEACNGKKRCA
jgi:putative glutamine amidotransferase